MAEQGRTGARVRTVRGRARCGTGHGGVPGDLHKLAEDLVSNGRRDRLPAAFLPIRSAASRQIRSSPGAFRETFVSGRRTTVVAVLRGGQERGQVRDDVDLEVATDLLYGPIWYRRLVQQTPLTPAFADELAEAVTTAIETP